MSDDFDGDPCQRCNGTGRVSRDFDCPGCDGGRILTARGKRAWAYYLCLLRKPAREFRPGELMQWQSPGGPVKFYPVTEVADDPANPGFLLVRFIFGCRRMWAGASCRFGTTGEFKQAARDQALVYQAILDKNGKDPTLRKARNGKGD